MGVDLTESPLVENNQRTEKDRRTFLRDLARCGSALAVSSYASRLSAEGSVDWSKQIGIQLTVVRDEMAKDVEVYTRTTGRHRLSLRQPGGL